MGAMIPQLYFKAYNRAGIQSVRAPVPSFEISCSLWLLQVHSVNLSMKNYNRQALSSEVLMQKVAILHDPRDGWMAALYCKGAERNSLAFGTFLSLR